MRAELLLLSPSFLVPCLSHNGIKIWDTLAIAEYLAELKPRSQLLPREIRARAHCRSVSGEMHSGFYNLRSALPMNLHARHELKVFPGARATSSASSRSGATACRAYGGPYLFGPLTMADAMYAPVCTRFLTYDVKLDIAARITAVRSVWPAMEQWVADAKAEPDELEELDAEF